MRRRGEGGDYGVAHVGNGGVPAGLELGALELLALLLVGVLVAAQGLGVGELAAAVLALVLPAVGGGEAGGFRGEGLVGGGVGLVFGLGGVDVEAEELEACVGGGRCVVVWFGMVLEFEFFHR